MTPLFQLKRSLLLVVLLSMAMIPFLSPPVDAASKSKIKLNPRLPAVGQAMTVTVKSNDPILSVHAIRHRYSQQLLHPDSPNQWAGTFILDHANTSPGNYKLTVSIKYQNGTTEDQSIPYTVTRPSSSRTDVVMSPKIARRTDPIYTSVYCPDPLSKVLVGKDRRFLPLKQDGGKLWERRIYPRELGLKVGKHTLTFKLFYPDGSFSIEKRPITVRSHTPTNPKRPKSSAPVISNYNPENTQTRSKITTDVPKPIPTIPAITTHSKSPTHPLPTSKGYRKLPVSAPTPVHRNTQVTPTPPPSPPVQRAQSTPTPIPNSHSQPNRPINTASSKDPLRSNTPIAVTPSPQTPTPSSAPSLSPATPQPDPRLAILRDRGPAIIPTQPSPVAQTALPTPVALNSTAPPQVAVSSPPSTYKTITEVVSVPFEKHTIASRRTQHGKTPEISVKLLPEKIQPGKPITMVVISEDNIEGITAIWSPSDSAELQKLSTYVWETTLQMTGHSQLKGEHHITLNIQYNDGSTIAKTISYEAPAAQYAPAAVRPKIPVASSSRFPSQVHRTH